jgi:hypothetical protein
MFFAFGQFNVAYVAGWNRQEYSSTIFRNESFSNGVRAQFFPAFGINVSKHAALAFSFGGIGYDYSQLESDNFAFTGVTNTQKTSNFEATFGQQANITVQWTFGHARRGMRSRYRREPMSETRRMRNYEDDEDEAPQPPARRRAPRRNTDSEE